MKGHSLGIFLMFASIAITAISLILFFLGPVTFYFAIAGFAIALIIALVSLFLVSMPVVYSNRKKAAFKDFVFDEPFNYKKELDNIRANYFADKSKNKNRFNVTKSPENEKYLDFKVLSGGEIFYGYIVIANGDLFQRNYYSKTLPADIVYSKDEYFESDPLALKKIAEDLCYNYNSDDRIDSLELYKKFITNEMLPLDLTDGREVYVTTVMIHRRHLPLNYITDPLLPIIADPLNSTSTFVVDSKYWTEAFVGHSINGISDSDII
ncbi:MAG: hypothetical protein J6U25_02005 [Clostridia bacterium]|nr:hypothetical protein [Clostridia bacterium]